MVMETVLVRICPPRLHLHCRDKSRCNAGVRGLASSGGTVSSLSCTIAPRLRCAIEVQDLGHPAAAETVPLLQKWVAATSSAGGKLVRWRLEGSTGEACTALSILYLPSRERVSPCTAVISVMQAF